MEELLKNRVNHFLVNFAIDSLQFSPYIFWILEVHNIENNLIVHAFNDDALHYSDGHLVFFDLFLL